VVDAEHHLRRVPPLVVEGRDRSGAEGTEVGLDEEDAVSGKDADCVSGPDAGCAEAGADAVRAVGELPVGDLSFVVDRRDPAGISTGVEPKKLTKRPHGVSLSWV